MTLQNLIPPVILRASLVLTNSYVYSDPLEVVLQNQANLYIDYTKGSSDSGEVVVEFSNDKTNWYSETFQAVSAGVETDSVGNHTFTATGSRRLMIPIMDRWMRVGAKCTNTVTGTLMKIIANIGTV